LREGSGYETQLLTISLAAYRNLKKANQQPEPPHQPSTSDEPRAPTALSPASVKDDF